MSQSKKSRLFLIVLLAISLIAPVFPRGMADGYGEDSLSLGQVVDDYENDDDVSVAYQVINNQTLDCMELNYTIGEGPLYQNFSEYTEVDSAADLTVTERVVTWETMRRDAISWVVYDFGADYFDDFTCNFTLDFSDIEAGDISARHIMEIIVFSNTIGTFADVSLGGDLLTILPKQVGDSDDLYNYELRQYTGGVSDFAVLDTTNYAMAKHYGTLERLGTTITLRIYTDEARTNLIETLTDTGSNQKYRYFHVMASYDSTADGADHSSGLVANVTFEKDVGGYESNGYFTTTELLSSINGCSLVLMTNSTLNGGTLTVEFSPDNSTWTLNDWEPILGGYESIDLRVINTTTMYLRYNFTRGGPELTPRLFQTRLISTEGAGDFICVPQFFNASSIEVIVGTLNDGNLASTYFVDGDWFNVSEVVGTPGIDIRVNFTDVGMGCGCFEFFQTFTGHPHHDIEVQLWNFTSTSWNTIGPIFFNETANWACIGLGHNYTHFFDGGELFARFYHEGVGHVGHELHVDRIDLSVIQAEECPPAIEVLVDYSIIFLAIGLIICLAIYFLYSRLK